MAENYLDILDQKLSSTIKLQAQLLHYLPFTTYSTHRNEGQWFSWSGGFFTGSRSMTKLQTLLMNPGTGAYISFSQILDCITPSRRDKVNAYIDKILEKITDKNNQNQWDKIIKFLNPDPKKPAEKNSNYSDISPANGTERVIAIMYCKYFKEGLEKGLRNLHEAPKSHQFGRTD